MPFPPVIIVVLDNEHGKRTGSLLSRLLAVGRLPLRSTCGFRLPDATPRMDEYAQVDMVVLTWERLSMMMEYARISFDRTKLILWDDAHRIFGPDFRRSKLATCQRLIYKVTTKVRRFYPSSRSLLVGPRAQLQSLSLLRDEVLGACCMRIVLRDAEYDAHVEDGDLSVPFPSASPAEDCDVARLEPPRSGPTFFDLPSEIRNRIYLYAVDPGRTLNITTFRPAGGQKPCRAVLKKFTCSYIHAGLVFDHVTSKWVGLRPSHVFALSRVSKQLAVEILPSFYADTTFEFETVASLNVFVKGIGSLKRHLRYVKLTGTMLYLYSRPVSVFRTIEPLVTLERFSVQYKRSRFAPAPGRGQLLVSEFVYDIKAFLLNWHEARKVANGYSGVLDFVHLTRQCCSCNRAVDDDMDPCTGGRHAGWVYNRCIESFECGRFCPLRQFRRMRLEVRKEIAKVLGLNATTGLPIAGAASREAAESQELEDQEIDNTETEAFLGAAKEWLGW